jgi:acyl-CoA reductase-like NAD-dependent aldehyde dehydrogenase
MSTQSDVPSDPEPPSVVEDGAIHGSSPLDGEPLDPVPVTPAEQLPTIVERARSAGQRHAARQPLERAAALRRFKDAVLARGDALVRMIRLETGKPDAEAWLHEVLPTADLGTFWSEQGPTTLRAEEPSLDALQYPGKRAMVQRVARGVIGVITPWNFPVALPLRTLFPALMAGNAVVLKPSEHTPRCAALLADAAREVFDPDLVQVVQGAGAVGQQLVGSGIDAVVFTGSVPTGKQVARAAAEALVPTSLELGGKDPAIVLDDARLERTARGILWGAMANSGQNCAGIERVYATPGIASKLRDRLASLARELVIGRDVGPMTTAAQQRTVERHVRTARSAGADVLAGGEPVESREQGQWFAPTVLGGVPSSQPLLTEETFGPVVAVEEVSDAEAAVRAANASRYALTASVWTRDLQRAEHIAGQLRAGVVVVNNHGFTGAIASLPWGGTGDSGYGVTNSLHALDVLTRPRTLVVDASRAKRELWWHPYTPALTRIARALTTLRGRAGWLAKLRALGALLGGLLRRWKT